MKVLFTIDTLLGGGAEQSLLELIHHFSKDVDVTVCYFYNKHDLREQFSQAPCKLIHLDLKGKYNWRNGVLKLLKIVKKNNYDVIVTSLYRASIISRLVSLLTRTPLVDTIVNDSYGLYKKNEFKGIHKLKYYFVYWLDRLTAGIPNLWISNAEYIAGSMAKKLSLDKRKIIIIRRGRRVQEMSVWQAPALNTAFHFISIGRLTLQKGQVDLIRAFNQFNQKHPDSRLTIYGEGSLRKDLQQLVDELNLNDKVTLHGRTPDAWRKMYEAHCFVLPSYYEGFSGALIEALILGIPLICSDMPMNCEAVRDRENGLLYKVGQIDQLLQTMNYLYEHNQESIERGKLARKDAITKYDIRFIAKQYQDAISKCIA